MGQAADPAWTGTWSASSQSSDTTSNQQTLRQIIGGTAARIQLSNAFGNRGGEDRVHIAQRASGSSITASTDRKVTFGGSSTTTIPAGGAVVSDSIAFSVSALSDVAIGVYLPEGTGPATFHQQKAGDLH